jgi:hypothetical protein
VIVLAKRRINNKTRINSSDDGQNRPAGKAAGNNTVYLIIIAALVLIIAYLLSGSGPNRGANPAISLPGSFPDGDTIDQPLLYSGDVPEPNVKPEFVRFFPENISGMRRVKLQMDPLNTETEGLFHSKVVDQANVMYLSDSPETDFEVEYSVYKMESPEAASEVLNFYTSQWNNVPLQFDNFSFWVWKGYEEQLQAGKTVRPYGTYIYWDTFSASAFLPMDGRSGTNFLSTVNQTLYCYHGEAAQDEYFIMVDVHAPVQNLEERSNQMLARAAKQITS